MKYEFNWPSSFRGEDVWKCWRTTDGRRSHWYTISSPMSLRLRWAKNQIFDSFNSLYISLINTIQLFKMSQNGNLFGFLELGIFLLKLGKMYFFAIGNTTQYWSSKQAKNVLKPLPWLTYLPCWLSTTCYRQNFIIMLLLKRQIQPLK